MGKIKFSCFLLIALFFLYFPAVHAEPEVSVRKEHYHVEGDTVEELSEWMKLSAPPQLGGHFALTKSNVSWNYETVPGPGGCSAASSNVKLEIIFYLPEWRGSVNADEKTHKKWKKFIKNLQRHEDGHQKIGLEAARKIEKFLNGPGSFKNCPELKLALNQTANAVMDKKQADELRYDALTQHGQRQGAQLKYVKPAVKKVPLLGEKV